MVSGGTHVSLLTHGELAQMVFGGTHVSHLTHGEQCEHVDERSESHARSEDQQQRM